MCNALGQKSIPIEIKGHIIDLKMNLDYSFECTMFLTY